MFLVELSCLTSLPLRLLKYTRYDSITIIFPSNFIPYLQRRKAVGSNESSSSSGMEHGLTSLIAKLPSDSSALQDPHDEIASRPFVQYQHPPNIKRTPT